MNESPTNDVPAHDDEAPFYDVEPEHDTSQLPTVEEIKMEQSRGRALSSGPHGSFMSKKWLWIAVASLVGIAIIVGVSVGVSQSNASSDPEEVKRQRLASVEEFLVLHEISSQEAVDTPGTPQNLAAAFMAVDDALQMKVPASRDEADAYKFIQRYALCVFYYATGGDSWDFGLDFVGDKDTCSWYSTLLTTTGQSYNFGALCGNDGQVDRIFAPFVNMKGTLPSELGLLTALTYFAIPKNSNMTGPIPEEIVTALTKLEILDLSDCTITGTIPEQIGNLGKLVYLSLGDNKLTGKLPASMGTMHEKLEFLSLDGNMLVGGIGPVETLTNLRFLYLEHNMFERPMDSTMMEDLKALEQIDLSDNAFSGDFPLHLLEFPELDVLDLSSNTIDGSLPDFLPNVALNYLFLHGCSLHGSIPPSIMNLQALHHLDLSENELEGVIPSTMGNLTQMVYLFLAKNKFDSGPFPEFIQNMTNLRDLSLKHTNLNGNIPTWISKMSNLLLLDLHRNKLEGPIPTEIGNMTGLVLLLLNQNRLTGTIPTEMKMMSSLGKRKCAVLETFLPSTCNS